MITELFVLTIAGGESHTEFLTEEDGGIVAFDDWQVANIFSRRLEEELPDEPKTTVTKITFDPPMSPKNNAFVLYKKKQTTG